MQLSAAAVGPRWVGMLVLFCAVPLKQGHARLGGSAPPTMDDLWEGNAHFVPHVSFAQNAVGFPSVDAGTRVVVVAEAAGTLAARGSGPGNSTTTGRGDGTATWYLFGRTDTGPTATCPQGEIGINVRASTDLGLTWSTPSVVVQPSDAGDNTSACLYADGSAFFDANGGPGGAGLWHYLVQVLDPKRNEWCLAHFTREGASPLGGGPWLADPHNPVVTGGQLFNPICTGAGKHCQVGMRDEGTPEIVGQAPDGDFYVTFHGCEFLRRGA
jgi:hypothetical protein